MLLPIIRLLQFRLFGGVWVQTAMSVLYYHTFVPKTRVQCYATLWECNFWTDELVSCKPSQDNKISTWVFTILPGTVRLRQELLLRFKTVSYKWCVPSWKAKAVFIGILILVHQSCHFSNTPTSNVSSRMGMLNVHASSFVPRPSLPPVSMFSFVLRRRLSRLRS